MDAGADIGRIGGQAGAHYPAQLAVRLHASTDKLCLHCHNKIASQALPDIMEVIVIVPNVSARPRNRVALLLGVLVTGTAVFNNADRALLLKLAEGMIRRQRWIRCIHTLTSP